MSVPSLWEVVFPKTIGLYLLAEAVSLPGMTYLNKKTEKGTDTQNNIRGANM